MSNRTEKKLTVKKHSQLSAVVIVAMAFIMAAVTFNAAEARDIWRTNSGLVSVVKAERGSVNQHPKAVGPRELYFALRAIRIRQKAGALDVLGRIKKQRRSTFLFSDRDARLLTPHILQGLKQAGSNQDVVFSIKQSRGNIAGSIVTSAELVTSGRIFFAGDRLNIIFGSALNDARLKTGSLGRNPRRFGLVRGKNFDQGPPGSRRSKSRLNVRIVPDEGIALTTFKGKKRDDWVQVVSLEAIALSVGAQAQQGGGAPSAPQPQLSVEDRLAKLKTLRDQGLISDEVYKQQTVRVLDSSL